MDGKIHPHEIPRIADRLKPFGSDYIRKPPDIRIDFVNSFILFSHPIEERRPEIDKIVQPSVDYDKNMLIIN